MTSTTDALDGRKMSTLLPVEGGGLAKPGPLLSLPVLPIPSISGGFERYLCYIPVLKSTSQNLLFTRDYTNS